MSEPFLGQITLFAGNFAPRGWAFCQGQTLSIAQNTALFSILGTTYGGNGQTTFALPDLRSKVPIQQGQGPGLSSYTLGQSGGNEVTTLQTNQIPPHTHSMTGSSDPQATGNAAGNSLGSVARGTSGANIYATGGTNQVPMASQTGPTGGGQPVNNVQPYLTLNFIIALEGIFPSRN